jgi:HD-GYP domain-containing protein (c-di-GMP phosphodiesterase class II)
MADTFDAMTTDRPYRKGLSTQAALGELRAKAGSQFDPLAVDAFVKAFSSPESDRPGAVE